MSGSASLPRQQTSDTDDPRVVEEAAREDYSLHVVPRSWPIARFKLTMAGPAWLAPAGPIPEPVGALLDG